VYFIQPTGHSLKPLDVEVMRRLHTKVNLIPVIAKADTLTDDEIAAFKQRVSLHCDAVILRGRSLTLPDSC
jgi:septin 7